jgi:hypothetical protein
MKRGETGGGPVVSDKECATVFVNNEPEELERGSSRHTLTGFLYSYLPVFESRSIKSPASYWQS